MEKEKRIYNLSSDDLLPRVISEGDGKRFVEGYGSVFNHKSRLIFDWDGLYYEVINPTAFDRVLQSEDLDVLLTFNHDNNRILGRYNPKRGKSTMQLSIDEKGLKYRAELPNTPTGTEVYELISRGDLYESSFVFTVKESGQRWEKDEEGNNVRYINEVSGLYDVSVVYKGAYSDTDVETAKRHFKESEKVEEVVEEVVEERADVIDEVSQQIDEMTVRLHQIKK